MLARAAQVGGQNSGGRVVSANVNVPIIMQFERQFRAPFRSQRHGQSKEPEHG